MYIYMYWATTRVVSRAHMEQGKREYTISGRAHTRVFSARVRHGSVSLSHTHAYRHTHTHARSSACVCAQTCVCMCVCARVCVTRIPENSLQSKAQTSARIPRPLSLNGKEPIRCANSLPTPLDYTPEHVLESSKVELGTRAVSVV